MARLARKPWIAAALPDGEGGAPAGTGTDAGGGGGAAAPSGAAAAPAAGASAAGTQAGAATQTAPEAKFTQADLDRIIGERLAAERKSFDQKLADEIAKQGKTELEKAQLEKQQAEDRAKQVADEASTLVRNAKAEAALAGAGVKPENLATALRLADLTGVKVENGQVDATALKAAVDKVITDFPMLKGAAAAAGASGNDLGGGKGAASDKPVFTRQQIKDMPQEERVRRADELALALSEGRIQG